MQPAHTNLVRSIRSAIALGVVTSAMVALPAYPQTTTATGNSATSQPPAKPTNAQTQTLQAIEVVGTHIRSAELAGSNPQITIGEAQIKATGQLTIGGVIQQLPQITGAVHTPNLDFGGGTGATFVGLRGLGASRTLVLIDGQRVQGESNQNADGPVDLNSIPAAAVQSIEILTDGASAIYGSDAIGGVINIILKSKYDGAQFTYHAGISDRGDAQTRSGSFLFGHSTDKGSMVAAVSYNKFDPVLGSARSYTRNMLFLTTTSGGARTSVLGAGGTGEPGPYLNVGVLDPGLAAKFNCPNVTTTGQGLALKRSAWRAGTSPTVPGDYRCYTTADNFNANATMYLVTPQERTSGFFKGTYHLTDHVSAFLTSIYSKNNAQAYGSQRTFGSDFVDGVAVSKDNYFNPFGVDFSQDSGNSMTVQLPGAADLFKGSTTVNYVLTGLEGNLDVFGNRWTWNVGLNYSHISLMNTQANLPNEVQLADFAGPSFLNAGGVVQCGTPADPIPLSSCTPWDPFNTNAPTSKQVLAGQFFSALNNVYLISREYHAGATGGLVTLPAGTVELAFGAGYRKQYQNGVNDPSLAINAETGTCTLGGTCTGPATHGGFDVKYAYGELFIPLVENAPLIHDLSISLGDRFERYSDFGDSNTYKAGVQYRPITDLLLRGTVSTVFRAPSVKDLFSSPFSSGQLLNSDPCEFVAPTKTTPNPNAGNPACVNVPALGTFLNPAVVHHGGVDTLAEGSTLAGFKLNPEVGKSFDFGAVYSPSFVPGLSLTADVWRIYLNDTITVVAGQTELNLCFNGVTVYCPLIKRLSVAGSAGDILHIITPTANLGRLDVKGVDFSAKYDLPPLPIGQFGIRVAGTYLAQFKSRSAPLDPSLNVTSNGAGLMAVEGTAIGAACPNGINFGGTCYLPRVRGQGTLDWRLGALSAQWQLQFNGRFGIAEDPDTVPGLDRYGATVYSNFMVQYALQPINTTFQFGVNNVFDRKPPLLYMNRVPEFNTDTEDFDILGRYYWASIEVSF